MTTTDKQQALQLLAAVLQDNAGNRLTLALINGLLVTVDNVWLADPVPSPASAVQAEGWRAPSAT